MYLLWVTLLVSVVTALLPKGLHTVQQHSSRPTALLKKEKMKDKCETCISSVQTKSSLRQLRCPKQANLNFISFSLTLPFLIMQTTRENGLNNQGGDLWWKETSTLDIYKFNIVFKEFHY
jgi:hypothetical protein